MTSPIGIDLPAALPGVVFETEDLGSLAGATWGVAGTSDVQWTVELDVAFAEEDVWFCVHSAMMPAGRKPLAFPTTAGARYRVRLLGDTPVSDFATRIFPVFTRGQA